MPWRAFGRIIRQKMRQLLTLSVCAAWIMFRSIASNAPRAVRYMSGRLTITAATTAARQVKTSGRSIESRALPMALRFPRKSRRKKPTTVGGRTSGRVMTASAIVPARRLRICSTP